jgi:hypothetical protein
LWDGPTPYRRSPPPVPVCAAFQQRAPAQLERLALAPPQASKTGIGHPDPSRFFRLAIVSAEYVTFHLRTFGTIRAHCPLGVSCACAGTRRHRHRGRRHRCLNRVTIHRWRNTSEFTEAVSQARATVDALLADPQTPPDERLHLALTILGHKL